MRDEKGDARCVFSVGSASAAAAPSIGRGSRLRRLLSGVVAEDGRTSLSCEADWRVFPLQQRSGHFFVALHRLWNVCLQCEQNFVPNGLRPRGLFLTPATITVTTVPMGSWRELYPDK